MHKTTIAAMLAALALTTALGCGESAPAAQDAGPDGGDYSEHIIEGGGTTGGPIDGLLVLWFFDEPSGEPIEGMRVMVGSDPGTALTGSTDASGQVVFEDPSLSGPTDVHSLADGYPAGSLYGLNATYVTLERREIGYEPDPPTIEIGGTSTGWDTVPQPDDPMTQHRIAFVNFGQPLEELLSGDYETIEQADDPQTELPVNMLAPDLPPTGKIDFTLEVYERVGALYAIAGIYDTVAETFTAYSMALEAGVDPTLDLTEEIELDFSIEILEENTVELMVDPIPAAYEVVGGQLLYDLGADGTLGIGTSPTSTGDPLEIRLPDVSAAPFDQAGAYFVAYAGQDVEDDADNFPNGSRFVRDVTVEAALGTTIEIDDLLEPPLDLSWDGDGLALTTPSGISYCGAHVEDDNEDVLWGATVFDPPVDAIALPEFPADWGWDGLPDGYLYIETGAAIIDGDVNEAVFDDLWYDLVSASENRLEVE